MSNETPAGEDALNSPHPISDEAALDDFERALRAVAPAGSATDGCTLDPPFDAGLIGAWLQRPTDSVDAPDPVAAHLSDCAGCRALLPHLAAPLPVELVGRMVSEAAPRRSRRWAWTAGAAAVVAIAAAVALAILPPTYSAPDDLFEPGPLQGGVALSKSVPGDSSIFVPSSRVRWILRPDARLDPLRPVRAFESAPPGSPLTPLPADAATMRAGGAVVLDASAGALFGDSYGPRTIYLGIAREPDALADAAGDAPPADSGVADGGVRWYRVDLEYRAR